MEIDIGYHKKNTAYQKYIKLKDQRNGLKEQIKKLKTQGIKDSFEIAKEKENTKKRVALSQTIKKGKSLTEQYSTVNKKTLEQQIAQYDSDAEEVMKESEQIKQQLTELGENYKKAKTEAQKESILDILPRLKPKDSHLSKQRKLSEQWMG